jgi:hypothetical protein
MLEGDGVPKDGESVTLTCFVVLFQVLEENIRKVKLSTPDYREMGEAEAIKDFKRRRGEFGQVHGQLADLRILCTRRSTVSLFLVDREL